MFQGAIAQAPAWSVSNLRTAGGIGLAGCLAAAQTQYRAAGLAINFRQIQEAQFQHLRGQAAGGRHAQGVLRAFDDAATDADTQTVTVSTGGDPTLGGAAETISKTWCKAIVTDTSGGILQGTWSESGIAACSDSTCTLSNIHKKITSVTFTAAGSGKQITVFKP